MKHWTDEITQAENTPGAVLRYAIKSVLTILECNPRLGGDTINDRATWMVNFIAKYLEVSGLGLTLNITDPVLVRRVFDEAVLDKLFLGDGKIHPEAPSMLS